MSSYLLEISKPPTPLPRNKCPSYVRYRSENHTFLNNLLTLMQLINSGSMTIDSVKKILLPGTDGHMDTNYVWQ